MSIFSAWARPRLRSSKVRRPNNSMSETFLEARPRDSDWIGWLRHELAPTRGREIRTAIIVAGAVLCVIISIALKVPQLAYSNFIVFFYSTDIQIIHIIDGHVCVYYYTD